MESLLVLLYYNMVTHLSGFSLATDEFPIIEDSIGLTPDHRYPTQLTQAVIGLRYLIEDMKIPSSRVCRLRSLRREDSLIDPYHRSASPVIPQAATSL